MLLLTRARADDLGRRELSPTKMVEYYENRSDFLYKREVTYGARDKKFGPQTDAKHRPMLVRTCIQKPSPVVIQ